MNAIGHSGSDWNGSVNFVGKVDAEFILTEPPRIDSTSTAVVPNPASGLSVNDKKLDRDYVLVHDTIRVR